MLVQVGQEVLGQHVVDPSAAPGLLHVRDGRPSWIDRRRFVVQAGGGAIDDQIEVLGRDFIEVNRLDAELFGKIFSTLV